MKPRILILDDHKIMRIMIRNLLGEAAYDYVEASDGREALSILLNDKKFDVILCDYNMPGMDGLQFLTEKNKNKDLQAIPLIMVTSASSERIREKCQDQGINGWLMKPFKREQLVEAVKTAAEKPTAAA